MNKELNIYDESDFRDIIAIIETSKQRAMKAVNAELIEMYWQIGAYVSARIKDKHTPGLQIKL